mmetsp:Transcript_132408/g.423775  ORF Transcript_132408/g.423775 Transcript_132408/m.423775 type:complete len:87 (+) Transcript_132408:3-263(+)
MDQLRQSGAAGRGAGAGAGGAAATNAQAAAHAQAVAVLEQRFEAALQAIGRLHEELEATQEERDTYRRQCQDFAQHIDPGISPAAG